MPAGFGGHENRWLWMLRPLLSVPVEPWLCQTTTNPPGTIQDSLFSVTRAFDGITAAVVAVNPQCDVMIGETGWPSAGISFNNSINTVENARSYFEAVRQWSLQRRVVAYYFEAIDEAWKSNRNAAVPPAAPWQGPNGAEGHYGVWAFDGERQYVPKFPVS